MTLVSIFWGEFSNPAMHLRIIVKQLGLRYTNLYESLELIYISLYTYGRLFKWVPIIFKACFVAQIPVFSIIASILLLAQSLNFMIKMAQILMSRYTQLRERLDREVEMNWFTVNPKLTKLSYFREGKANKSLW